nr:two-component system activity regulator YycH [Bacillus sp. JCM 19034]
MKKEHIKSAILIFLIGMSVILSWNLYTYQPDIALIDVSSRYVSNELIGEERSLNEIVRPDQAVVYADDELALIPRYHNDFETLISMMLQANYDEDPVFVTEPYPLVTDRGGIELVFPTLIPTEMLFSILAIDEEYQPVVDDMDRLFLYIHEANDQVYMQYYSSKERRVGSLKTNISVGEFERLFLLDRSEYIAARSLEEYRSQSSFMTEHLYVTTEPITVEKLSYGFPDFNRFI